MRSASRWLTFAVVLLLAAAPAAARKKDEYVDTKKRFSLKLPSGWKLHPRPGDTGGMMFRKDVDGTFGIFSVNVRPLGAGETLEQSLSAAARPFEAEIGYTLAGDTPASIGLLLGMRRTFTVYASGDRDTVRAVEMHVLHAFGYVHTLHFETLEKHRRRYQRDHDRLIGSYEARAGRKQLGKLVGTWRNEAGGPPLVLQETTRFSLGALAGTWSSDGGQLSLHVPEGTERYRYALQGNRLTLRSSNLDGPAVYVRSGASVYEDRPETKRRARPLRRDELVGRWKALDTPSTEPLVMQLAPSGSVAFGPMSGSWKYRRGLLTIRSTAGVSYTYHVTLERGRLLMSGGDLERELWLERE
jgi:hypothetical protein